MGVERSRYVITNLLFSLIGRACKASWGVSSERRVVITVVWGRRRRAAVRWRPIPGVFAWVLARVIGVGKIGVKVGADLDFLL